jgi:hypothetical protein
LRRKLVKYPCAFIVFERQGSLRKAAKTIKTWERIEVFKIRFELKSAVQKASKNFNELVAALEVTPAPFMLFAVNIRCKEAVARLRPLRLHSLPCDRS